MKIGIIGAGNVGGGLATAAVKVRHSVTLSAGWKLVGPTAVAS